MDCVDAEFTKADNYKQMVKRRPQQKRKQPLRRRQQRRKLLMRQIRGCCGRERKLKAYQRKRVVQRSMGPRRRMNGWRASSG